MFNKFQCADFLHTAGTAIKGCEPFREKFRIKRRFKLIDQNKLISDFHGFIIDKTVSDQSIANTVNQHNLFNMSGFDGKTVADMIVEHRPHLYDQLTTDTTTVIELR